MQSMHSSPYPPNQSQNLKFGICLISTWSWVVLGEFRCVLISALFGFSILVFFTLLYLHINNLFQVFYYSFSFYSLLLGTFFTFCVFCFCYSHLRQVCTIVQLCNVHSTQREKETTFKRFWLFVKTTDLTLVSFIFDFKWAAVISLITPICNF